MKISGCFQCVWRGYCVRAASRSKKLAAARQRIQSANAAATEENTLGHRTSSALDFLLRYKDIAYILEALRNLGEICFSLLLDESFI